MAYVIKASRQGFDAINPKVDIIRKPKNPTLPHLLFTFALPYLFGAKEQVKRYQTATLTLKIDTINSIYRCLHEASTLFEDLSTVAKYIEKCGYKNEMDKFWFDVRNHIRHDIREEFDNNNDKRKNERALRLKINPTLQMDLGFTMESIDIGGVTIKITQINEYLGWAEKIINKVLDRAKINGFIH